MQGCQPGNRGGGGGELGKRVLHVPVRVKSGNLRKNLQIIEKLRNLIGPREKVASLL